MFIQAGKANKMDCLSLSIFIIYYFSTTFQANLVALQVMNTMCSGDEYTFYSSPEEEPSLLETLWKNNN